MNRATLTLHAGQASHAGRKSANQDSLGIRIPSDETVVTKGVAAIIADGVSTSEAGKDAAETCVTSFLADYYSTPDSWSVEKAAGRVLGAVNRWLHGEGQRRHRSDHGMVCTASAVVIKSCTAYLFHVGDSRIYLLRDATLEQLTRDHQATVDRSRNVLTRAMGVSCNVEIDFHRLAVQTGDRFLLTTDGVHNWLTLVELRQLVAENEPELAAQKIVQAAIVQGSDDNVSAQILAITQLPTDHPGALYEQLTALPYPPALEPGQELDGYRIVRELHASKRSQVYLAIDMVSEQRVALKTPSVNFQDDPVYIDQFMTEEWVGRRINNPHVLKMLPSPANRRWLYGVAEYVNGCTLREWMQTHPNPELSQVREIAEQIAKGLRAFHRLEMVHQDLKPENILINGDGTVKIIDFGAVRIRGSEQIATPWNRNVYLGTEDYAAPECLAGEPGSASADRYALAVIVYEMLTARLPYSQPPHPAVRYKVDYRSTREQRPDLPHWLDACLAKAVALAPAQRYAAMSEFLTDLSRPNPALPYRPAPLIQRLSARAWRIIAVISVLVNIVLMLLVAR